jgi:hypothetical protein
MPLFCGQKVIKRESPRQRLFLGRDTAAEGKLFLSSLWEGILSFRMNKNCMRRILL